MGITSLPPVRIPILIDGTDSRESAPMMGIPALPIRPLFGALLIGTAYGSQRRRLSAHGTFLLPSIRAG